MKHSCWWPLAGLAVLVLTATVSRAEEGKCAAAQAQHSCAQASTCPGSSCCEGCPAESPCGAPCCAEKDCSSCPASGCCVEKSCGSCPASKSCVDGCPASSGCCSGCCSTGCGTCPSKATCVDCASECKTEHVKGCSSCGASCASTKCAGHSCSAEMVKKGMHPMPVLVVMPPLPMFAPPPLPPPPGACVCEPLPPPSVGTPAACCAACPQAGGMCCNAALTVSMATCEHPVFTAEVGASGLAIHTADESCMCCESMVLKVPGADPVTLCVSDKRVCACGAHMKAMADRLIRPSHDNRIILEGHVELQYHNGQHGTHAEVGAEHIAISLTDGQMEIRSGPSTDKPQPASILPTSWVEGLGNYWGW